MGTLRLPLAAIAAAVLSYAAFRARKPVEPPAFHAVLPQQQCILHALNRLTFGARPGDAASVRRLGVKKWVDRQLHPERVPENPELLARLEPLETLGMSAGQLVEDYPPPQVLKALRDGRVALPADPRRRALYQRLLARYGNEAGGRPALADVLDPGEAAELQRATLERRVALLRAMPADKLADVLLAMPPPQRRSLISAAPADLRRQLLAAGAPQRLIETDLAEARVYRALYSNRQLAEVLTDFWFNHFNVFLHKGADRYLTTGYERDAIRPHVLGRFRDLLEATATSPAMLFYLDNWQSVGAGAANGGRRGLNENYGRELLELHTLGVDGGYTQTDVTEVARCFTGWTIRNLQRGGEFFYNDRLHDKGAKTLLGVAIPAGGGMDDGEKVLDILAARPATARFISMKLAQRFVADQPPQSLVDRMATKFLKTHGDLRQVMSTMLNSREFWSRAAYESKIKSPLEFVIGALRATDADVSFGFGVAEQIGKLGQPQYGKQEPTGYSNISTEWVNSSGLLARMNFAVALASGKLPGVKLPAPAAAELLGSPEFQRK